MGRLSVLFVVLLVLGSVGSARAQQCELIQADLVRNQLDVLATAISSRNPSSAQSILKPDVIVKIDTYDARFDRFLPNVFRGSEGWDDFISEVDAFQDFSIDSMFARLGCRVAIVFGRFHVAANDEYAPWFYTADFRKEGDKLVLRRLRLPTPLPRKFYENSDGERVRCEREEVTPRIDQLRSRLISALESGSYEQITKLFSPDAPLNVFDPTLSERVRSYEVMNVAGFATANFFRGSKAEDIASERLAYQFCSNLAYGGVLKVSLPSGSSVSVEYSSRVYLEEDEEPRTSWIEMTLLDGDIANNVPEDVPAYLKPTADEVRAWIKR